MSPTLWCYRFLGDVGDLRSHMEVQATQVDIGQRECFVHSRGEHFNVDAKLVFRCACGDVAVGVGIDVGVHTD